MATATELTLTLGRTVYSGDPDSDERVQAREARVSVTWSLGEDEQDLTLTTSALAEEAERALAQMVQPRQNASCENTLPSVPQKQGMNGQGANGRSATAANSTPAGNGSTGNGSNGYPTHSHPAHSHPGNGNGYGNGRGQQANSKQAGPEAGSGRAATASPETTSEEATTPRYGGYIPPRAGNGHSSSTGSPTSIDIAAQSQSPSPASAKAQSAATQSAATQSAATQSAATQSAATQSAATQSAATQSAAKAQAITRAQCLAVHSHCNRRGIAQWEMLRLVAEHFGKHNLEDLDKNQGGELLNMLQQAEHEQKSGNPDYAN